jgi:hypothetical protein
VIEIGSNATNSELRKEPEGLAGFKDDWFGFRGEVILIQVKTS